jgi:hypothetical protein
LLLTVAVANQAIAQPTCQLTCPANITRSNELGLMLMGATAWRQYRRRRD